MRAARPERGPYARWPAAHSSQRYAHGLAGEREEPRRLIESRLAPSASPDLRHRLNLVLGGPSTRPVAPPVRSTAASAPTTRPAPSALLHVRGRRTSSVPGTRHLG